MSIIVTSRQEEILLLHAILVLFFSVCRLRGKRFEPQWQRGDIYIPDYSDG
jgi:hypothetical protein